MKEINISHKKFGSYTVFIDDEDFELVSQYSWLLVKGVNTFYAKSTTKALEKGSEIRMHRLILGLFQDSRKSFVDHIDGNGLNNQKENLRIVTHQQNCFNSVKKSKNNLPKGVGLFSRPSRKPYFSRISLNGKTFFLGFYTTVDEAAEAYNKKAKELFGDFAKTH